MLGKAQIAMKGLLVEIWTLKVILLTAQKEKGRAGEKASIYLEKKYKYS